MANDVTIDPRYSKYTNKKIEEILDSVETIDTEPTADSPNPVSSGGVAQALGDKLGTVTQEQFDEIFPPLPEPEPEPEPEEEP